MRAAFLPAIRKAIWRRSGRFTATSPNRFARGSKHVSQIRPACWCQESRTGCAGCVSSPQPSRLVRRMLPGRRSKREMHKNVTPLWRSTPFRNRRDPQLLDLREIESEIRDYELSQRKTVGKLRWTRPIPAPQISFAIHRGDAPIFGQGSDYESVDK